MEEKYLYQIEILPDGTKIYHLLNEIEKLEVTTTSEYQYSEDFIKTLFKVMEITDENIHIVTSVKSLIYILGSMIKNYEEYIEYVVSEINPEETGEPVPDDASVR